jgi:hypothetical protein
MIVKAKLTRSFTSQPQLLGEEALSGRNRELL